MENYEVLKVLDDFNERVSGLEKAIKLDELKQNIINNEKIMMQSNFYDDMKNAQKVLKQDKKDKNIVNEFNLISTSVEELQLYYDMQKNNEVSSEEIDNDVKELIKNIETNLSNLEEMLLLSGPYDDSDAIFELHPGAGGTESQDWASMLFRMYKMFSENNGYEFEVLDYQDGDEAGIKSVTFVIKGDNAYGYLKSEHGVHRLVRISPFDSNARRHTSFCGCTVTPVITDNIDVVIKDEDIRIDTYRSSGAGGQHINKTDSAIRITHFPTGIVVTCQNERSQIQNKERAFEILKAKLFQLEQEKKDEELRKINGEASNNGFGSQIRSYVFHPYSMVKDLRTGCETANIQAVMDGDIKEFLNSYLKYNAGK